MSFMLKKFGGKPISELTIADACLLNDLREMEDSLSRKGKLIKDLYERVRYLEDTINELDDTRNVDAQRIEALEDYVYDEASIDVGSDIEDEDNKVNCGETTTISNGNGGDDTEWPKDGDEYWYIGYKNLVRKATPFLEHGDNTITVCRKEIGNCFRTEEEAEAAVEKLKAWKRLRDGGFKFKGWKDRLGCTEIVCDLGEMGAYVKDLDLLFGEELPNASC